MMRNGRRLVVSVGIAAVALAITGTVLAASPSPSPSSSPEPDGSATASSVPSAAPSLEPSASSSASPLVAPTHSTPPASTPAPQVKESEPEDEADGPPTAEKIADVVSRLKGAGIPATSIQVQVLSSKVGLGGAVRVLAFAQASGKTPAQILAMFTSGMGWGQISHELNLSIGPGIGWIMGHGHGHN
jgi:hypothetical protein